MQYDKVASTCFPLRSFRGIELHCFVERPFLAPNVLELLGCAFHVFAFADVNVCALDRGWGRKHPAHAHTNVGIGVYIFVLFVRRLHEIATKGRVGRVDADSGEEGRYDSFVNDRHLRAGR